MDISTELLVLRFRNAIADKEFFTACANGETAKFGEWQSNWHSPMQEIEQEITDIRAEMESLAATAAAEERRA